MECSINSTLLAELAFLSTCSPSGEQVGFILGEIVPPVRALLDDESVVLPDIAVVRAFQPLCSLQHRSFMDMVTCTMPPAFPSDVLGFYRIRRSAANTLLYADAALHSRYGGLFAIVHSDLSIANSLSVTITVIHQASPIPVTTPNLTESSANEYTSALTLSRTPPRAAHLSSSGTAGTVAAVDAMWSAADDAFAGALQHSSFLQSMADETTRRIAAKSQRLASLYAEIREIEHL